MAMMSEENQREVKPWDFLKKDLKLASAPIAKQRMEICKQCKHFFKLTKQCKLCMCIMPAKVTLADAFCPIHKWEITTKYKTDDEDYDEDL